jgi:glycosyltransferase involved in cell wall biosynthesis
LEGEVRLGRAIRAKRIMLINHVTYSLMGGAGSVAKSLAHAQAQLGHNTQLVISTSQNLRLQPLKEPFVAAAAVLDNLAIKRPKQQHQLSVTRSRFGSISPPLDRGSLEGMVVNLHWIEGVLNSTSQGVLLESGAKLFWTLHDFAPFTGGCHTNTECRQFEIGCPTCPIARPLFQSLVRSNFERKLKRLGFYENTTFIVPSRWMELQAKSARLLKNSKIELIQNPIAEEFFDSCDKVLTRRKLSIGAESFVISLVANQLNDPLKGVSEIKDLVGRLIGLGDQIEIVFVGNSSPELRRDFPKVRFTGALPPKGVAQYMAASDLLISTSKSETSGLTVQEAAGQGVPTVAMDNPGLRSGVIQGKTAFVVSTIQEMASAISSLVSDRHRLRIMGEAARAHAINAHSPRLVASRYLRLYSAE